MKRINGKLVTWAKTRRAGSPNTADHRAVVSSYSSRASEDSLDAPPNTRVHTRTPSRRHSAPEDCQVAPTQQAKPSPPAYTTSRKPRQTTKSVASADQDDSRSSDALIIRGVWLKSHRDSVELAHARLNVHGRPMSDKPASKLARRTKDTRRHEHNSDNSINS